MSNPDKTNLQKNAFIAYEADAWFERNKAFLEKYSTESDRVVGLIRDYNVKPSAVLEIGCSWGYRLNGLHKTFNCKVYGVEPSQKAVDFGRKTFPDVTFHEGTADNLSHLPNASVDVVIVGFVFYVIDREIIFRVVSEIDRVLKNGGLLIIIDFFSETSLRKAYHHIKDFSAYSFKQNYDEIFTSSRLYYLLDKSTMNHVNYQLDATEDYDNKYSITLLKKDLNASYK